MPVSPNTRRSTWLDIGEGVRLVAGHPLLRALAIGWSLRTLAGSVFEAVFVLYVTRELGISPALLGLSVTAGGLGFVLGALLTGPVTRFWGVGPTLIGASFLVSLARLVLALAGGSPSVLVAVLFGGQVLLGLGMPPFSVNQVSIRQATAPPHLQGRGTGTIRFAVWGTVPLGAVLGGLVAEVLGLRPTLIIGAMGMLAASLWLLVSPLRMLHDPVIG